MTRAWICMFFCLATALPAQAADYTPRAKAPAAVAVADPLCADPKILARIMERFAWAERHTWHRGFEMSALTEPRLRYPVLNGPSLIAHVHCQANAAMTNQTRRTVYYTVEAEMGFASIGKGIDFCVVGLDPWHVHNEACRTVR